MVDILFVFPTSPEPRNINVINLVKNEKKTAVTYWKKNDKTKDYFDEKTITIPIEVTANDCNPFKRIIPTVLYYVRLKQIIKKLSPKYIYVSKLDSLLLIYNLYKRRKNRPVIMYDISDMHPLVFNDSKKLIDVILKKIFYGLEKKVSTVVSYVVVTSMSFWNEYYIDFYSKDRVIFIPNAPDLKNFKNFSRKKNGRFTIGFIGSIRYYNQLKHLIDASQTEDVDVLIAGDGVDYQRIKEYTSKMDNITMLGRFDYSKDIKNLYEKVDCVFAVYDTSIKNVRIALPNRLYEAAFCGLPLLVSNNTYLSELVTEYNLGKSVDDKDINDMILGIRNVKKMQIDELRKSGEKFLNDNNYFVLSEQLKKKIII